MKNFYVDREHNGIADLMMYGNGYLITRINIPREHRHQGYGTALLKQILNDADANRVTLYLEVSSNGETNALSNRELTRWYKRHGFKLISRRFMRRIP